MIELYESIAEGYSYRESLRLAKLAMLENPQFHHPYYWAAFHLQEGFR
jgi:CHAT domain-containing protein